MVWRSLSDVPFSGTKQLLAGRREQLRKKHTEFDSKVSHLMKKYEIKKIIVVLRILTGKKHPKVKLQRLREIRIWTSGSLVHRINSF